MENLEDDEVYQYIVISQEDEGFIKSLNQASLDGWEVVHSNSFPVQKPDYIKNSISVVIIYTALLKRKVKIKKGEEKDEPKSGNKK